MNSDKPTILPSCVSKYISFDFRSQIRSIKTFLLREFIKKTNKTFLLQEFIKKTKRLVKQKLGASERIRLKPLIRYSKYQIEIFFKTVFRLREDGLIIT